MTETPEPGGLATALVALSHHVLHLFADAGRGYDLTQQQVELLCAVIVPGRMRMKELGRQLHMEKSALSNLVERVEQRGLAVRVRDSADRRVTWVELTGEGTRLAMQTHSDVTARLHQLVAHLPAADQHHLTGVVDQVLAEVQRTPPRCPQELPSTRSGSTSTTVRRSSRITRS